MTLRLSHVTTYRFDRFVHPGPLTVRLRPRKDRYKFSMSILPGCPVHWERDILDNWQGTFALRRAVNFISIYAVLDIDLRPSTVKTLALPAEVVTLVEDIGKGRIRHVTRLNDGVQSPRETMEKGTGTCRDMAWLLASMLRERGHETRFVSGYLLQPGLFHSAELHAWTDVRLGDEWVGLDPVGGPVGGRHIALASAPHYLDAEPVSGCVDERDAQVQFSTEIGVVRVSG